MVKIGKVESSRNPDVEVVVVVEEGECLLDLPCQGTKGDFNLLILIPI